MVPQARSITVVLSLIRTIVVSSFSGANEVELCLDCFVTTSLWLFFLLVLSAQPTDKQGYKMAWLGYYI